MSDSRPQLFQAVLERPADDAPRFAYAGYCDAQGDPYGAFIRAQLERTQALRHGTDQEASRLGEQADNLRSKHGTPEWTRGVEKLVRLPTFIRGFVDDVIVDAERYLAIADELYRRAPIRQLILSEVGHHIVAIAKDPHLGQLVSLSLGNTSKTRPIGDAGVAELVASPHLRNLKKLQLPSQGITMAGLEALCAAKTLPSLVYVNLAGNQFEDPIESYGTDWVTGRIVPEGIALRDFGKALEQKYGDIPWLHGPSRLMNFPPMQDEL